LDFTKINEASVSQAIFWVMWPKMESELSNNKKEFMVPEAV
jgi:hypothetical protein